MTNLEFKNEADFLAINHNVKHEMFDKMCKAILTNYNKIAGEKIPYDLKRSEPIIRLFAKLDHIAFTLYSAQSIPDLLKRIATKPVKVISKPEYKGQPEVYGKGHFRWDFKAYTLNENELKAIRIYFGLHIKEQAENKAKYNPLQPKPNFDIITDYNEQAESFLNWTNTSFKAEFKEHSTYFPDDKETRDIYIIVLKNEKHRYRFTFGQSISNTGNPPRPYDILSCLTKYDVGSFDNFCGDFGYEKDSRNPYKIYKAVLKEWKNVELLFNEEQLELLQEIQ